MIAKAMNFEGKVVFDTTRSDGQFKKTASNKKLAALYPEYGFVPIQEGLEASCRWFEENFDTARKGDGR